MIKHTVDNKLWKQIKNTTPTLTWMLEHAFDIGAVVAGGYPRLALRGKTINQIFAGSGDIDIFFRTKQGYEEYIELIKLSSLRFEMGKSGGGSSTNMVVSGDGNMYAVQMIGCHFGDAETILGSFDFYNCMVAFDRENLWRDDRQEEHEKQDKLGIMRWDSPLLLSRVVKYISRHRFTGLTDECREKFIGWVYDTYCTLPKTGTLPGFNNMNQRAFKAHLTNLFGNKNIVTDADLVLFGTLYGDEIAKNDTVNYEHAFNVLKKRIAAEEERLNPSPVVHARQDYARDSWY